MTYCGYIAIGLGALCAIGSIVNHCQGKIDRGIQCEITTILWFILATMLLR